MKRIKTFGAFVLVALVLTFSLVGCADNKDTDTESPEIHKLGETVSTDVIDFTLDRAEFAIALHDGTAGDWEYICMPKEFEQSDDNSCFVAAIGHTLVSLQFTIYNKNRVNMTIDEDSFVSVEYAGNTYTNCECKTGSYPSNDGHDWDGVTSLLIDAGSTLSYRCGVDIPTEVSDLTDDFNLIVSIPTSEDNMESFVYSVTAADLTELSNQELTLEDAIKFFGYDDGYQYFVNHMDDYSDLSTDEITSSLVGQTFNCYFMGEMSHLEKAGTFQEDNQFAYEYKSITYTIPYTIEENYLTINAKSDPFSGTVRQINDTAYLMVNNEKPCGIIFK